MGVAISADRSRSTAGGRSAAHGQGAEEEDGWGQLHAVSESRQVQGMVLMDEIHVVERKEQPFYTVETLARRLAVTPRTVKNMIRDGEIASYRFRGCRRIDKADVDSFLANHRDERRHAA
jgi:excisionase family DNA binding protein